MRHQPEAGRLRPGFSLHPMQPIVQISLDLTNIDEALETAAMAMRAGADWLEAGTPLILAEGLHGVRALRAAFPSVPIVADLKTMDGGYLEAEMMAKAGATHVVVMARAHEETIKVVVRAGKDHGVKVMGDNLGCPDMVGGAKRLEELGCDYVIHHIGYDERRGIAAAGRPMPSPLDQLREVVACGSSSRAGGRRLNLGASHPLPGIRGAAGRFGSSPDHRCRCVQNRHGESGGLSAVDLLQNSWLWGSAPSLPLNLL